MAYGMDERESERKYQMRMTDPEYGSRCDAADLAFSEYVRVCSVLETLYQEAQALEAQRHQAYSTYVELALERDAYDPSETD